MYIIYNMYNVYRQLIFSIIFVCCCFYFFIPKTVKFF